MMTTSIPDLSFRLRLTVMALAQGEQQHEHEPRGEATLQVLHGRIRVLADGESWDAGAGDLQHLALSIATGRTNTLGRRPTTTSKISSWRDRLLAGEQQVDHPADDA
jgi:hypothetical protein